MHIPSLRFPSLILFAFGCACLGRAQPDARPIPRPEPPSATTASASVPTTVSLPTPPTPAPIPAPVILLWPEGAPGALGDTPADKPSLTAYLPDPAKRNGASMLVLP